MNFQEMFTNHKYNSESFEYPETINHINIKGGAKRTSLQTKELENIPNGGFPPIYECKVIDENEVKDNTKREYKSHKETVSIQQLLASRRNRRISIK
jgi:hypothetical protein